MEVPPLRSATELARALFAGADPRELERLVHRLWPDLGVGDDPRLVEARRAVAGLIEQLHERERQAPEVLAAREPDDLLATATELLGVNTGCLLRCVAGQHALAVVATCGPMARLDGLEHPEHALINVVRSGHAALLPWPRLASGVAAVRTSGQGAHWAAVPLRAGGAVLGALVVGTEGQSFARSELSLIQLVGDLLAAELHRTEWASSEPARAAGEWTASPAPAAVPSNDQLELQRLLGLAHDFGNLLTVVLGFTSLCEAHCPPAPNPVRGWLRQVQQAAARAQELARQILGRSNPGHSRLVTPVARVLEQCGSFFHALAGEGHRLEVQAGDPALAVELESGLLERAILNLLINARNATPGGGTMTLSASTEPRAPGRTWVRITVGDDGPGLPPERLRQLLEPPVSRSLHGGLGLVQVQNIVRAQGGDIRVETAPGRGCRIHLLLPMAAPASGRGDASDGARGALAE